jgi:hypothetical protein
MQNFIHDSYNQKAYIKAYPRKYDEMRFEYRPMLSHERTVIVRGISRLPDDQQDPSVAAAMAKRLVVWDITHAGKPVPITAENVLHLQSSLFQRLWEIVADIGEPFDADPKATPAEAVSQGRDLLEAAIAGRLPADVRDEAAVKN